MLFARRTLASLLLAVCLAQVSLSKHINKVKEIKVTEVEIVEKIGQPVTLKISEPYVNWHKNPDHDLGERFFDDDFHQITRLEGEAFKSLTIKKLNYTDAGLASYYGVDVETKDETRFNLFLYDLDNQKSSLVYEETEVDLHEQDPDGTKGQKLEIELKTFTDQPSLGITYKKEAMPLDGLLVNGKKVKSEICNHEDDGVLVKCLEVNVGKEAPFEACKNKATYEFGYEFDHADKFTGKEIKKYTFKTEFDVKYPPKLSDSVEIVLYEDVDQALKLDCSTTCANPADNLKYEWKFHDKVIHESRSQFDLTFASLQVEEHSAEIVCTVSNGIEAGEFISESQRVFKIQSLTDPETTTEEAPETSTTQSTTTAQVNPETTTASSNTPGKPSNASSEFGFFGNIYNRVKFFVQFAV